MECRAATCHHTLLYLVRRASREMFPSSQNNSQIQIYEKATSTPPFQPSCIHADMIL